MRRVDLRWRKSSFSEQPEGNCLELAACRGEVFVRESDEPGVLVSTTADTLRVFLDGAKAGEFDSPG
ncbi:MULTISPECIES: DUF397 domain-containing protein [unclassified Streptomyces]|uniref:DUF397 domain-containing protein n=1 Tax=unclassified Streptomyces TaxID=2593676 RepID=UPI0027B9171A|nr:DUF397 domain-containing protein [Streptomyces sp. Ru87]